ncbi:MAG TPA: energy transducer TonB [Terriglobales bacterium]|jgi:TonB family protein|nr:energy transducer TonB [Terriglobales bacterium]
MPTANGGFQLGLLPEKKWNWRTFATSYGILAGLILLLAIVGVMTSDSLLTGIDYHVTELIPRPSLRPERMPKPHPVHAKLLPPEPVFQAPKLVVPHEIRAPKPQPQEVEPPKVTMNNFAPAVLTQTSAARPVLVHTGEFAGSSVTPTVNAPISKVQTGGFGDPNGLKPSDNSKPNGKLIASAAGSFDMPIGAGQGNGSGGAKGIKGTVASADFGSGVATGGHGDGRAGGRGVQTSGFGSQEVAQNTPHVQRMDSGPASTPVEITSKPNPIYTEEARNLKLEGEVLLEVEFAANGQLHVNRVVRGLGHGLDEAAVAAANKMRFKPAQRSGQAIDSTAIVHVVFQLAY